VPSVESSAWDTKQEKTKRVRNVEALLENFRASETIQMALR
jgi:hypothetical protein